MIKLIPQVIAAGSEKIDIESQVTANGFFGYKCITELITTAATAALYVGVILVFIFLVWGGFKWLTSGGDKAQVESAQKMLSNTIVGFVILASSWAIYLLIINMLGINMGNICSANPVG